MTTTFGRRTAAAPRPSPPAVVDPRMEALAATIRAGDPSQDELKAYFARRREAVGPWTWIVNGLHVAAPLASYALHAPLPLILAISAASVGSRSLLKRGRLRWAEQIEAEAKAPDGPRPADA